jgi:hypothetical protein
LLDVWTCFDGDSSFGRSPRHRLSLWSRPFELLAWNARPIPLSRKIYVLKLYNINQLQLIMCILRDLLERNRKWNAHIFQLCSTNNTEWDEKVPSHVVETWVRHRHSSESTDKSKWKIGRLGTGCQSIDGRISVNNIILDKFYQRNHGKLAQALVRTSHRWDRTSFQNRQGQRNNSDESNSESR